MPRLKPPSGYITASEARELLGGISYATLSQYVGNGWLDRFGPEARKQKFYSKKQVIELNEMRASSQPSVTITGPG